MRDESREQPQETAEVGIALGPLGRFLVRQPLGTKFALAFGSLLCLVALTGALAARGLFGVRVHLEEADRLNTGFLRPALDARNALDDAQRLQREFLLVWPQWGAERAGPRLLDAAALAMPGVAPEDRWSNAQHTTVAELIGQARGKVAQACAAADGLQLAQFGLSEDPAIAGDVKRWRDRCAAGLAADLTRYGEAGRNVARLLGKAGADGVDTQGKAARTGALREVHRHWLALKDNTDRQANQQPAGASVALMNLVTQTAAVGERLAVFEAARAQSWPVELPDPPTDTDAPDCTAPNQQGPPENLDAATARLDQALQALTHPAGCGPLLEDPACAKHVRELRTALAELRRRDGLARTAMASWVCQGAALSRELDGLFRAARGPVDTARAEAMAGPGETFAYVSSVSLLVILAGIALAYALTRNLQLPIRSLSQAAAEVAQGNLDAEALVYSTDEIGRLATTFNAMTGKLAEQKAEITQQMREIEKERARSEQLLLNILPGPIAERLKLDERPIADAFDEATVLFADVVGYTALSSQLEPREVVEFLGRIFTSFDRLAAHHEIEKIKTIGDAYMAACGLPNRVPDHCARMARMALAMQQVLGELNPSFPQPLQIRIGLHTGPVVAGVIGQRKFLYDLWGDAVNIASRMESHGRPGAIQVTEAVQSVLQAEFVLEPRGEIEIKGKGLMMTWWLIGERAGEALIVPEKS